MSNYSVESFEQYVRTVKSASTAEKYADSARRFLTFCKQLGYDIESLPPGAVRDFVTWLVRENQYSESTVSVYTAGARAFLRWCHGHGLTVTSMHADLPKKPAPEPHALRGPLIELYLHEASKLQEPCRSALLLLPFTGLRSIELVNLTLTHGIKRIPLEVRGSSRPKPTLCLVVVGKGGKRRIVPILEDGVTLLARYLKDWRQHVFSDNDWVFPGNGGQHISTRILRHHCQAIRERAPSLHKLTPHTLRDTYTTALWAAGVDMATITKAVGHADMKTTFNHYLDIREQDVVGNIVARGARLVPQANRPAPHFT